MLKDFQVDLELSPRDNRVIQTGATYWSHDVNTAKIYIELLRKGTPIILNKDVTVRVMMLFDDENKSEHIYTAKIEDELKGLVSITLEESMRMYVGQVTAGVYLEYGNEEKTDNGYFTFGMRRSLIDKDMPELQNLYVSDFEKALEDIKEFKVDIDKNIEHMKEHFDSRYDEAKTDVEEIEKQIKDNNIVKQTDFDKIKEDINTKYYLIANDVRFDATGQTDMSSLIQSYLEKGYNLLFPRESEIKLDSHIIVRNNAIIDFNYSTIISKHHAVIVQSNSYPSIKNLNIVGTKSSNGAVALYADWEDWGTRGTLENIKIRNFDIGMRTVRAFRIGLKNIDVSDCIVGWSLDWLPYERLVTNLISSDGVHITKCKVGVYTLAVHNTTFNNLTVEHCNFGFVQNQNCKEITFNNGWFESNKINYTFGSVDLKTGNVTELDEFYVKAPFEIDNLPTFNNVRYMPNIPSEPNNLISEKYSFLSHYIKHTKNDELEMLFKQGIGYRNINNDYIRKVYSNDGTVSNTEVRTPYGVKKITTLSNEKNSSACISTDIDKSQIKTGDIVLLQAKVKSNVTTDIMMTVIDFSGNLIGSKHRNFRVKKGAWRNVFTIAKLDDFSNGASFRVYPNKNNVAIEDLEFSVYDMQVVNLTHSFPDIPIPNDMSSVLVAPKFPYVDYLNHGKTDLGQISSRYYAENKPSSPHFGRIIYNMNTHKTEVWNGDKWVELLQN